MDRLTKEQRHHCMAAIRGKDTRPEIIVRKFLFGRGYRYRMNHPRLLGRPDIVLRRYRTVIFVNGCFWHGHENCSCFVLPKSNVEFWQKKIERNRQRDVKVQRELAKMGWHCITIWECQLKKAVRKQTLESLDYTLSHIYLTDRARSYQFDDAESLMAAEPETEEYGSSTSEYLDNQDLINK